MATTQECACGEPAVVRVSMTTLNGELLDLQELCAACAKAACTATGLDAGSLLKPTENA